MAVEPLIPQWLLVSGHFRPSGGQDLANYVLASRLAARGRRVGIVAHEVDQRLAAAGNVGTRIVPMPLGSFFLGERRLELAAYAELRRMSKVGRTILVGNAGNCPRAEVSWVHFVHAAWTGATLPGKPLRTLILGIKKRDAISRERAAFENARVVIANSDLTCSAVKQIVGERADKVLRIWFGASPGRSLTQPLHARPPLLAFVGALGWDTRKGLDIAMRAFGGLTRNPAFTHRLVVAGFGDASPWRDLGKQLGVSTRVDFLSFVPDVPQLLSRVDLLLSPVRYEPYGLAIQEAIMEGVPPLVGAGRAGIAERFPASLKDLIVPEPEDPERWMEYIQRVLANLDDYRERTKAFAGILGQRSWEDFADDFIDTVESRILRLLVGSGTRFDPGQLVEDRGEARTNV